MPRRNKPIHHTPFRLNERGHLKRAFHSEKEALHAAELQMLAQPRLELAVYKCDICGKWHLTSQQSNTSSPAKH